jgi:HEAT repeat protein
MAIAGLVLLTAVFWLLSEPRYQGKSGHGWFQEVVKQSGSSASSISELACGPVDWGKELEAFRVLGDRGVRIVLNKYRYEPPFYIEWYEWARNRVGKRMQLPGPSRSAAPADPWIAKRLLLELGTNAVPELLRMSRARVPEDRAAAASLLGELGPGHAETRQRLLELLADPSADVLYHVLEVLWMTQPDAATAVPTIFPFLTHTNSRVRVEASYALGWLKPIPPDALDLLLNSLEDTDPTVRANAARVLGLTGIQSPWILERLDARMSDTVPLVGYRAAEALARLCGPEARNRSVPVLETLQTAVDSGSSYFQLIGLDGQSALQDPPTDDAAVLRILSPAFHNPNAYVRCDGLRTLALWISTRKTRSDQELRSMLVLVTRDPNGFVRQLAKDTLEKYDSLP